MKVKELIENLDFFNKDLEVEVQWGDHELKIKNVESQNQTILDKENPKNIIIINANPSWEDE